MVRAQTLAVLPAGFWGRPGIWTVARSTKTGIAGRDSSVVPRSAVIRWCRMNGRTYFAWQTRFYDHVIQDEAVLRNIRKYILDNLARWKLDTNTLEERTSWDAGSHPGPRTVILDPEATGSAVADELFVVDLGRPAEPLGGRYVLGGHMVVADPLRASLDGIVIRYVRQRLLQRVGEAGGLFLVYVVAGLHRGSLPAVRPGPLPDAVPRQVVEPVAPGLACNHVNLLRYQLNGHRIITSLPRTYQHRDARTRRVYPEIRGATDRRRRWPRATTSRY